MKKRLFTVMATIVVICAVCVNNVNAQCFRYYDRGAGLFGDGVDFYAGFGAGAALVNDMAHRHLASGSEQKPGCLSER